MELKPFLCIALVSDEQENVYSLLTDRYDHTNLLEVVRNLAGTEDKLFKFTKGSSEVSLQFIDGKLSLSSVIDTPLWSIELKSYRDMPVKNLFAKFVITSFPSRFSDPYTHKVSDAAWVTRCDLWWYGKRYDVYRFLDDQIRYSRLKSGIPAYLDEFARQALLAQTYLQDWFNEYGERKD